jgi:ABC-type dipeptide/oligopeptide/nickel transport system permease component
MNRLLHGLLVLLGVVTLLFWLFQGLGDPARIMMGQSGDSVTLEAIKKDLHLDQSRGKQFLLYLNDISPVSYYTKSEMDALGIGGILLGDDKGVCIKLPYLRKSYQSKRNVTDLIAESLTGTILLAVTAMLFATLIGMLLGVVAALKRGTIWDTSSVMASILGVSIPSFFMAMLIAWIFGYLLSDYTGLQMTGSWKELDDYTGESTYNFKNLILPALTLGIRPLAIITQLTRSVMIEELQKDYILTAYAKGLGNTAIYIRHALRNALNPVVTAVSGWFAELLGGAFFIEYIFGWKGLGKLTVEAVEQLDYPLVMGCVLVAACFFILMGFITDLLYMRLDPRVRIK